MRRPAPPTPADPPPRVPRLEVSIRETLLWRFQDPDHADMLRKLGDLLYELVNESGQWGAKDRPWPAMFAELEAVADDLDNLVDYLEEEIIREHEGSSCCDGEIVLWRAAEGWTGRLARIAASIRSSVQEQRTRTRP